MTAEPFEDHDDDAGHRVASAPGGVGTVDDEDIAEPTAGMVLHRVLALAARTFLLNDSDGPGDGPPGDGSTESLSRALGTRPLWAQSADRSLRGSERRADPLEQVHQSRVAMRRVRSNLRTYRLLLDPGWGTALRAELAWYGNELGRSRDLDLLATVVADRGREVLGPDEVARLLAVVDWHRAQVGSVIDAERAGPRRAALTGQMMLLWDGPAFKPKAGRPAAAVMHPMLHRAWHDLRGVARKARKDPTDVHLHQLRIRLKDLRYGSETLALVEGRPARKTARAAERMQSKLGDLHDIVFSIGWLETLAAEQADLADAAQRLAAVQRAAAVEARKGWKRDLKDVERRWRRWQG